MTRHPSYQEAGPEDFLAPGETNLLRALTEASIELFGTTTLAVQDVDAGWVRAASRMAQAKRVRRELDDLEAEGACWHALDG